MKYKEEHHVFFKKKKTPHICPFFSSVANLGHFDWSLRFSQISSTAVGNTDLAITIIRNISSNEWNSVQQHRFHSSSEKFLTSKFFSVESQLASKKLVGEKKALALQVSGP